jgi:hypothetical protein
MTFPERSGTSVSGLKPLKQAMVIKVEVIQVGYLCIGV